MGVHRDVENVVIRLACAADEGELDAIGELVTDDVTLEMPDPSLAPVPGRAGLLAHYERLIADRAARAEPGRHLLTNIRVDLVADGVAIARSYVTFVVTRRDGSTGVHATATYEDRLAQVDGGWRLASRRIAFDRGRVTSDNH
jgi:3-phenylpropionate/cinnamic acid dioxygenase small subunit